MGACEQDGVGGIQSNLTIVILRTDTTQRLYCLNSVPRFFRLILS